MQDGEPLDIGEIFSLFLFLADEYLNFISYLRDLFHPPRVEDEMGCY